MMSQDIRLDHKYSNVLAKKMVRIVQTFGLDIWKSTIHKLIIPHLHNTMIFFAFLATQLSWELTGSQKHKYDKHEVLIEIKFLQSKRKSSLITNVIEREIKNLPSWTNLNARD